MIPAALKLPLPQHIIDRAIEEATDVGRKYREGGVKSHYPVARNPMRMARSFMAEMVLARFLELERQDPHASREQLRGAPDIFGSHVGWHDIEVRATEHPDDSHAREKSMNKRGGKIRWSKWEWLSLQIYRNEYHKRDRAFVLASVYVADVGGDSWVKYWGWQTGPKLFFSSRPDPVTGQSERDRLGQVKTKHEYQIAGLLYPYDLEPMDELVAAVAPHKLEVEDGPDYSIRPSINIQIGMGLRPADPLIPIAKGQGWPPAWDVPHHPVLGQGGVVICDKCQVGWACPTAERAEDAGAKLVAKAREERAARRKP